MLDTIRDTLRQEAEAILKIADRVDGTFVRAAEWMLTCEGRVIPCGIGKAGDVAKKFSSTLSSTGTPSLFLHPAEALHGDLGMVTSRDIVVLFSNSGETEEILRLYPSLREIGARTILVTGRPNSTAAKESDLVLDVSVEREACPHNLAPTTSTTVMLAVSDALALAVMKARDFSQTDYARYHPSGSLGRRLLLKVRDAMRTGEDVPIVRPHTRFLDVSSAITKAGAGAACVVDDDHRLLGLITDGDLRRALVRDGAAAIERTAEEMMNPQPQTIQPDVLAIEALDLFESLPRKIGEMPVVEEGGRVVGLITLKDLVRLGLR
jgi:arabinose-5-phosphate isomerase